MRTVSYDAIVAEFATVTDMVEIRRAQGWSSRARRCNYNASAMGGFRRRLRASVRPSITGSQLVIIGPA